MTNTPVVSKTTFSTLLIHSLFPPLRLHFPFCNWLWYNPLTNNLSPRKETLSFCSPARPLNPLLPYFFSLSSPSPSRFVSQPQAKQTNWYSLKGFFCFSNKSSVILLCVLSGPALQSTLSSNKMINNGSISAAGRAKAKPYCGGDDTGSLQYLCCNYRSERPRGNEQGRFLAGYLN